MSRDDNTIAPAVRDSLALCELREYACRSCHMSFDLALRRAMIDALAQAARQAADEYSEKFVPDPSALDAARLRPGDA